MSCKVAIASTDGKFINEHFGRAKNFHIFEIESTQSFKFVESREAHPLCTPEGHTQNGLDQAADILKDCQAVIVSQIGHGAAAALQHKGIKPIVGPNFIDDALVAYALKYVKETK